ncbi:hypothetical protein M407DRAFT_231098 [Tulasnella calospora MUT 4182]|uniref:Uncharacterized protein n=1 Tax=Tulasnella calospora MUT 4182 TaxID=1051891 RepID=A0A0C3M362_9AGAM|nr:hypothetical protein M407DRAFT_231098 [Tulasnella calospora MUT 4182]
MSHPYALPLHHHRNPSSTPSSSMSHISLASTYSLPQQHQGRSSAFASQTSGSTTSAGPSNRSDMAEASATSTSTSNPPPASTYVAPERRRRRSSRGVGGPSKPPSRKPSSTKSLAETKANPDEPLIPTRHYQFKSFESFDPAASTPSIQTYTSSSTTSLPMMGGGGYTFGPPASFAAETGQGGEAVDDHAGAISSSAGTPQQPLKKSKAIFSVGRKVVKEVLGGGGNNTPLPPEAKAVYYGRGGAGGAGARNFKPQPSTSGLANGVHPTPPHPPSSGGAASASQRCESRQTGSYYTGSSSNYTPSVLSSPYAESLASSPNATSVEDGQSVYAPSSYSAPLTMSSLGRPSPSHRSVSPSVSALSEDNWRRDSVVSTTTTSYAESSYGSDAAAESWQGQTEQQTVWQNPFAGETIPEVERFATPVSMEDPLSPPGGASEGSVTYDGAPAQQQQAEQAARQVAVPSTVYQQQQVLRHRPSQPSLLSSYPRHSRTQSGRITPSYSSNASATSSASSTPYQPSNATSLSAAGVTNLGGLYPISSAQGGADGDLAQNDGTNAARLQQVYQAYANGGASVVQQQQQQQPEQAPRTSAVPPQNSLRPSTSPSAGKVSRPLPDPLATAVGQLSLIQNPLNHGWPTPQPPQSQQQQQPKQGSLPILDPTLVSALYGATNAAQLPLNLSNQGIQPPQQQQQQQQSQLAFQSGTGLLTPNYTIQPQSQPSLAQQQVLGIVGAQDYTQSLIYQQALAEQQALARKLAQLERLQQAARLAAQDPFANLNSGRGFS